MAIAPRNRSVVGAFPEQIRQLGKIDGHPARLVARHAVHRSTAARFVLAVEPTNRAAAGIVDAITAVRLDDSPRGGEAAWWRWHTVKAYASRSESGMFSRRSADARLEGRLKQRVRDLVRMTSYPPAEILARSPHQRQSTVRSGAVR